MQNKFQNKVAFITGGASGIGAAIGHRLGAYGATVVLADRQLDAAEQTAQRINAIGGKATAVELDVRNHGAVQAAIDQCVLKFGSIDYLFNNAGLGIAGEVKDLSHDDWQYIVDVNLMGVINGVHAAYPHMIRQRSGHIVNTASVAGLMASPMSVGYCATKHAVVGLSRSLRHEAHEYGVRCSAVCPGVIRTNILVNAGHYGRTKIDVPADEQLAMWERFKPMDADVFAEKMLRQVAANREIIIVPWWWKLIVWFDSVFRPISNRSSRSAFREIKRKFDAAPRKETSEFKP